MSIFKKLHRLLPEKIRKMKPLQELVLLIADKIRSKRGK
jgi:hypothetical protein